METSKDIFEQTQQEFYNSYEFMRIQKDIEEQMLNELNKDGNRNKTK